jgi:hypothetical protein
VVSNDPSQLQKVATSKNILQLRELPENGHLNNGDTSFKGSFMDKLRLPLPVYTFINWLF